MNTPEPSIEELKRLARNGNAQALQTLRDRGFFKKRTHEASQKRATSSQMGIWLAVQKNQALNEYLIVRSFRLLGALDLELFTKALEAVSQHHAALRSRFEEKDGNLWMVTEPSCALPVATQDLSNDPSPEAACKEALLHASRKPFALETAPLWRVFIHRLGDTEAVCTLFIHHIIADAWSLEVIQQNIALTYEAFTQGRTPSLEPESPNEAAPTEPSTEGVQYWLEKLKGAHGPLPLPADDTADPINPDPTFALPIDALHTAALQNLATAQNTSLSVILQSLVKAWLYRSTGQSDLLLASPFAGRDASSEKTVGNLIQLLLLRDIAQPDQAFNHWVEQVHQTTLEALSNADHSLDVALNVLETEAAAVAPPNTVFTLQNTVVSTATLSGLHITDFPLEIARAKYDLCFEFAPLTDSLTLRITGRAALFSHGGLSRLAGWWQRLMESVLANPETPVAKLPFLTPQEERQLAQRTSVITDYPRNETILGLFAKQTQIAPNAIAVSSDAESLTYQQLDERSEILATAILTHRDQDFAPRNSTLAPNVVAFCLSHSPDTIVGMLAILKTGAAYLGLDPELPAERLEYMLQDAGVSLIIAPPDYAPQLPSRCRLLAPDTVRAASASRSPSHKPLISAQSPAAIFFTSGSTGRPKGVCLPHTAILRLVIGSNFLQVRTGDRVAHLLKTMQSLPRLRRTFEIPQPISAIFEHSTLPALDPQLQQPPATLPPFPIHSGDYAAWQRQIQETDPASPVSAHSIFECFEEQVRLNPHAVAVVTETESLTYDELNTKANRLAHFLASLDVGKESFTGLCLERGADTIVCLLAILKCGSAYMPLDPAYPASRLRLLIEEAQPKIIITSSAFSALLPADLATVIPLEFLQETLPSYSDRNPALSISAESLCYILFTSGTTGTPKGVCVPHRAVVRLVKDNPYIDFSQNSVFLYLAPLSFDASTFEIWGSLLNGAKLVIYPPRRLALDEFSRIIQHHGIDTIFLTTSLFNLVAEHHPETFNTFRQLLTGGEVMSHKHARIVLKNYPGCALFNMYGPTENTTFTTCHRVTFEDLELRSIPIGQPIGQSTVHILDAHLNVLPDGILGELCTGGKGLATAYLNRPDLTADRFVQVPGLGRLYRTGDLARRKGPDGPVEYFGRIDQQIKLRGFRIEPSEIEAVLLRQPAIRQAAVLLQGVGENRHLVAYFVFGDSPASPDLLAINEALRAELPEHMIPAKLVPVAEIPLTPSGKLDREKLLETAPTQSMVPSATQIDSPHPSQSTEIKFDPSTLEIWGSLLNGATLQLLSREELMDPVLFSRCVQEGKFNILATTTAILNRFAQHDPKIFAGLDCVVFGGEAVDIGLVRTVLQSGGCPKRLLHVYGPTECTTIATWHEVTTIHDKALTVPIGHPISNTSAHLLDTHLREVPTGVLGELYLGGDGLALGYLGLPELTAERFIQVPELGRLYKTGDLCRRRMSDGALEFVGRVDHQIKLRGHRIELGEIEARLRLEPGVADAVVEVIGEGEQRELAAYIATGSHPADFTTLRLGLQRSLPPHMLPNHFVLLERLPLNPNGRVDRKKLSKLIERQNVQGQSLVVLFATPLEELLAQLWGEVLGHPVLSREAHFFLLGGHSIKAMQLLPRLRRAFEVPLPLSAIFEHPTLSALAAQIQKLQAQGIPLPPPLVPNPKDSVWPLSFAQERLWFLSQLQTGIGETYNIHSALRFNGPLDVSKLRSSLRLLTERHRVLCAQFPEENGRPVVKLLPPYDPLTVEEISHLPSTERDSWIQNKVASHAKTSFDLAHDPLLRVSLLLNGKTESFLLFSVHHIVADGWSLGILVQELGTLMRNDSGDYKASLPPLPIQYGDYAAWQREMLQGETLENELAFWRQQLAAPLPVLELPTDFPRPSIRTYRGAQSTFVLPAALTERIRELSRQQDATAFMTLLAAFKTFLHRYSREEDLVVGIPVANRAQTQTAALVGLFVNTLALRTTLNADTSFLSLLATVRKTSLRAVAHQELPFERLASDLRVERNLSHDAIFQVMFAFENLPGSELQIAEQPATFLAQDTGTAKFDLLLTVSEAEGTFATTWEFSTDLFYPETIQQMASQFECLLASIVADPSKPLHALELQPASAYLAVLQETGLASPASAHSIVECFEEQVRLNPHAVAVVSETEFLTYQELNTKANRLAHFLKSREVGPQTFTGLCIERGADTIVCLLAILKCGSAYMPLDPAYPASRLRLLVEEARPKVILSLKKFSSLLPEDLTTVLVLDSLEETLLSYSDENLAFTTSPESLCYILFTSGTTGVPKGVCVPHRAVVRLVKNNPYVDFSQSSVFLYLAPLSFDASTFEIWGSLLNGAKLVIYPPRPLALDEFSRIIQQYGISIIFLTTSLFNLVAEHHPEAFNTLRQLLTGGEVMSPKHARIVLENYPDCVLFNMYGPTENTTFTTCHRVTLEDLRLRSIPIGHPIGQSTAFILDSHLNVLPDGILGELCTGGLGLATEYLNRPDLTADRFVQVPGLGRLYRTGDLARRKGPNAPVEYFSRIDQQIKLRGFRIEPGEIEVVLLRQPAIEQAAVLVQGVGENRHLVAYFVLGAAPASPDLDALKGALRAELPDHMVPAKFIPVAEIPLTPSGKLDRKKLQETALQRNREHSTVQNVPPRPGLEQKLADIWSKVLGGMKIGRDANFFSLGGDSILSIQIVAHAREAGLRLTVQKIFLHQTIAELALHTQPLETASSSKALPPGPIPLTPIQKWFLGRNLKEPWHFNQAVLLAFHRIWSAAVLCEVLDVIHSKHGAFHLRFAQSPSGWQQTFHPESQRFDLVEEDLRHLPAHQQSVTLQERATHWQRSLDLGAGQLSRAVLFHVESGQRLLWCIHHLAVDGVSWRILLSELRTALESPTAANRPTQPPRETDTSFPRWAHFLHELAYSPEIASETSHWEGIPPVAPLPLDFPQKHPLPSRTSHHTIRVEKEFTRVLLEEIHGAYQLQINDVLLTALALAVFRWTGHRQCLVALESHGRTERPDAPDILETVGWFTSVFPAYLVLPDSNDPATCLKSVKEQLRSIPSQGLHYGLRLLRSQAAENSDLHPAICFNYLGQFDQVAKDGPFDFAPEGTGENHSLDIPPSHALGIDALVLRDSLQVEWTFNLEQFQAETIEQLAQNFLVCLRELLEHCRVPSSVGFTPSDFSLAQTTQQQLDTLTARYPGNIAALYPVSPMQHGMLFETLLGSGQQQPYFIQIHCRILPPFDPAKMRAAWTQLLQRHPILRTSFVEVEHQPLQLVLKEVPLPWEELDLRHLSTAGQQQHIIHLGQEDRTRGFDLSHAPLFRCSLANLGESQFTFSWSFHHLLLDGWSLSVLLHELRFLYSHPSAPLPLRRPYEDYIRWISRQDKLSATKHWENQLAGFLAPTPLPCAGTSPLGHTGGANRDKQDALAPEQAQRVFALAASLSITVNTLIQAAWALLLHRLTGESDVVFGVTVSGRDIELPGVEEMLGLFINTLPNRVRITDTSIGTWLKALQNHHQANMPFAYLPLSEIQRASELDHGTPLFHSLFVFENYPSGEPDETPDALQLGEVEAFDQNHYPFTLVASAGQTINFRIGYDSHLLTEPNISRILGYFKMLLVGLADLGPEGRLQDLPLLTTAEETLLESWGKVQTTIDSPETLLSLFEKQAALNPEHVAVSCGSQKLTYRELAAQSRKLAGLLQNHGAKPGQLVALYTERCLGLITGVAGIVVSGAGYLPIDPETPTSRLAFLLSDARPVAIVTQHSLIHNLPSSPEIPVILLDDLDAILLSHSHFHPPNLTPEHLAYVIYTSGSTGQPKGVQISHANVVRLFKVTEHEMGFNDQDVWSLFHSIAFDFSVWELWGALLYGGRVVVVPKESQDPAAFWELLATEKVTILNQTPLAFRQLIAIAGLATQPLALRYVIFGGEALDLPALKPWFNRFGDETPRLVNMYGITETTVHVTSQRIFLSDTDTTASLIGRPLPDLSLFLLDQLQRPVPVGTPGEMWVGGGGVAQGYLNQPQLSAERFVELSMFGKTQRFYRSGDLARHRPDGGLEYLGRIDHQVKLRGFRIELGEIESTITLFPGVRETVVLAQKSGIHQRLTAYVVPALTTVTTDALRTWLSQKLPWYMVPTHFVLLPSFPMTVNGKINRRLLPDPTSQETSPTSSPAEPQNPTEAALLALWESELHQKNIGVHDDFFLLGGHSLLAMQIVTGIYRQLNVRLSLRRFFENPTIAALATIISESQTAAFEAITPAPSEPDYPLSHAQQRIWLESQIAQGGNYNMPEALRLTETIDFTALDLALQTLVSRHEILRTAFVEINGVPRQRILPELAIQARKVHLTDAPDLDTQQLLNAEVNEPFDLTQPPLLRVTVVCEPNRHSILVLVVHHIIGDAWSKTILYHELTSLYAAFRDGQPDPLPVPRLHYKDYAVWQNRQTHQTHRDYWTRALAGAPAHVKLPLDFPPVPPAQRLHHGDRKVLCLSPRTSDSLRKLATQRKTTLSNVVLALFKIFLFRLTQQSDLCLCSAVAIRDHPDLRELLGFFVNLLPIRTKLSSEMEFEQVIDEVTGASYRALEHQSYPFDLLVREIGRASHGDTRPFLDVVYVFQNTSTLYAPLTSSKGSAEEAPEPLNLAFEFAKFDMCLVAENREDSRIQLSLEFDTQLFKGESIELYLRAIDSFADQIAAHSIA